NPQSTPNSASKRVSTCVYCGCGKNRTSAIACISPSLVDAEKFTPVHIVANKLGGCKSNRRRLSHDKQEHASQASLWESPLARSVANKTAAWHARVLKHANEKVLSFNEIQQLQRYLTEGW